MNETHRNRVRSSQEIAEELIRRAAETVIASESPAPHVGDPWNCRRPVRGLPHGRFRLPPVETSANTLAMIARAAELRGWTIERFILDAAVAAAQERDRAAKRGVRIERPEGRVADREAMARDPNPNLRLTHGLRGIAALTAFSDDDSYTR